MGLCGAGLKRARPSTEIRPRLRSGRAYTAPQRATKLEALRRADAYETGSGQGPRLMTLGNGGMISFGVNRTIVKPPRRGRAASNPPLSSDVSPLLGHGAPHRSAVADPTLHDHLHAPNAGE